jgi:hypothetical protein
MQKPLAGNEEIKFLQKSNKDFLKDQFSKLKKGEVVLQLFSNYATFLQRRCFNGPDRSLETL